MPIKVLELHHHGIRIGKTPEEVEQARQFYREVLGLPVDTGRPDIPGIPASGCTSAMTRIRRRSI